MYKTLVQTANDIKKDNDDNDGLLVNQSPQQSTTRKSNQIEKICHPNTNGEMQSVKTVTLPLHYKKLLKNKPWILTFGDFLQQYLALKSIKTVNLIQMTGQWTLCMPSAMVGTGWPSSDGLVW